MEPLISDLALEHIVEVCEGDSLTRILSTLIKTEDDVHTVFMGVSDDSLCEGFLYSYLMSDDEGMNPEFFLLGVGEAKRRGLQAGIHLKSDESGIDELELLWDDEKRDYRSLCVAEFVVGGHVAGEFECYITGRFEGDAWVVTPDGEYKEHRPTKRFFEEFECSFPTLSIPEPEIRAPEDRALEYLSAFSSTPPETWKSAFEILDTAELACMLRYSTEENRSDLTLAIVQHGVEKRLKSELETSTGVVFWNAKRQEYRGLVGVSLLLDGHPVTHWDCTQVGSYKGDEWVSPKEWPLDERPNELSMSVLESLGLKLPSAAMPEPKKRHKDDIPTIKLQSEAISLKTPPQQETLPGL